MIFQFGEERFSRRIARGIVEARRLAPIATTGQLAQIVRRAVPRRATSGSIRRRARFRRCASGSTASSRGSTRFSSSASQRLRAGARLAVITFHSLEDRIVKHTFRALAPAETALRVLTRKPVIPATTEVARNPRARSAKLRAIERLA